MTETRSRNPFAVRDFRLLWAGEAASVLGDQFAPAGGEASASGFASEPART